MVKKPLLLLFNYLGGDYVQGRVQRSYIWFLVGLSVLWIVMIISGAIVSQNLLTLLGLLVLIPFWFFSRIMMKFNAKILGDKKS